jgi:plastocyanin
LTRLSVAIALCLLAAAGCGDEEEEPVTTVTRPANSTVRVIADDYSFDPGAIVLRGAGTLTVDVRNEGELAHNLKVRRAGEEIGGTPSFPAGERRSARINLEHGEYELICTIGDHAELGMTGTLRVR